MNEIHSKVWCDHCEREVVICGRCHNNTCNGGYGVEVGPEPGTVIECRACPSAYKLDMEEKREGALTPKSADKTPGGTQTAKNLRCAPSPVGMRSMEKIKGADK